MRARRLSALAVGALATMGAVPYSAVSAQAATAAAAATAEPATELVIVGQPGDGQTNGKVEVFTAPADSITAQNVSGGGIGFTVRDPATGAGFDGFFGPPQGQMFQSAPTSATTYSAQANADATHGTMQVAVSGNYNVCSQLSGSFTIDQYRWNSYNVGGITQLQVAFTESCNGGPVFSGVIRVNATNPLPPGAPSGIPPQTGPGTVAPLVFRRGSTLLSDASGTDGTPLAALDPQIASTQEHSAFLGQAAWAPLGGRLFFASAQHGLASVSRLGGSQAPIAGPDTDRDYFAEPTVSPDGSLVVYTITGASLMGDGGTSNSGLFIASTDGAAASGHGSALPGMAQCYQIHSPNFAPDGTLLYQCLGYSGGVDTYRWSHGVSTLLIANARHAVTSPDGKRIAFVRDDATGVPQIFTVGADGTSGLSQLTTTPGGAGKPAWSPDGRYLAYAATGYQSVMEIPAAGGAPVGTIPNADDPVFTPPIIDSHVIREWGADRISTAVAASQLNFADHGATGDRRRDQAGAVVLSRSDTFADALGGSALAVRQNAPLLITDSGALDPKVKAEISRVLAPGGKVYLLGGTAALSPSVASALSAYHVVRLAGASRYDTAVQIAKQISTRPRTVMVATGDNYPDALAAGATGEPVLLTSGTSMPKETAAYLNTLNPDPSADGGTEIVTIGGPGDSALHAAYLGGKLPAWPSRISRLKLAGDTRYSTALLVAQVFFGGDTDAALATGAGWPDALSGGAMVGHRGGPLLLTDPSGVSGDVLDYLRSQSASLFALHLLGGPAALPDAIAGQAAGVIGLPGHVRIDGFTSGGVYPFAGSSRAGDRGDRPGAKGPIAEGGERLAGSTYSAPMTRG